MARGSVSCDRFLRCSPRGRPERNGLNRASPASSLLVAGWPVIWGHLRNLRVVRRWLCGLIPVGHRMAAWLPGGP